MCEVAGIIPGLQPLDRQYKKGLQSFDGHVSHARVISLPTSYT